jgi:hypothetical protein
MGELNCLFHIFTEKINMKRYETGERTLNRNRFFVFCMICLSVSVYTEAQAGGNSVTQKGDFNLGLAIGVPAIKGWNAVMPTFSTDASWVLLSGLIDTKTFGKNGSVDLGVYYGFSAYKQDNFTGTTGEPRLYYHAVLLRSAFHFQFLDKLDTYAGIMSGITIRSYSNDSPDKGSFAYNLYAGVRYYLTPGFALKIELIEDFTPWLSGGVNFRF